MQNLLHFDRIFLTVLKLMSFVFSALNSFVLQSQKFDAQIQCGSHVAKAWSVFVEETDRMSKNVKESADSMATTILEKLNSLYTVRVELKDLF